MTLAAAMLALALAAPEDAAGGEAARHLVFLAEHRPIFVRLRIASGGRPVEAAWAESIKAMHAALDRNGDGSLTTKELDDKAFAAIVRLATGAPPPPAAATGGAPPAAALDVSPKDGVISIDELTEALRPTLGPFRLEARRQAVGRTDALYDQLDRDKDGALTRPELSAIAGSLRPLDLDDDEMIAAAELEPLAGPESVGRRARETGSPPVIEIAAGESSLRLARLLVRQYDRAPEESPGRPDEKLSPEEFAIAPSAFAKADANGDGLLDVRELRGFLAGTPIDLTLDVDVTPGAAVRVSAAGALPEGARVRQLADGDVEFAIGPTRLDFRAEAEKNVGDEVRRVLTQRFKAADANKDGTLDTKERATLVAERSPLAGLGDVIDHNGDGKVDLKELLAFGDGQAEAARRRLIVTAADQGRAIFAILDTDRDRRLGAREVMRTVDRVLTWDADADGRVSPDEIPYHFLVTIVRGGLPGLTGEGPATARAVAAERTAGPGWFRKMDRNQDGDISRREFLGPRDAFERLDRDTDGLIDPQEANTAGQSRP
jgi:Ca2+-binding EF-hand superfamily protein